MKRYLNILILTLTTIIYLVVGNSYAQIPQVPIPNPEWTLDSVVNGSVHFYTVQGDTNYVEPSLFVWNVNGGRLFYDQALTNLAGNGAVDTVVGNSSNITTLWVIWDSFDTPLDTGFIYVYEISSDGCQRSDLDTAKFQGMRIKVSAPPDVRFIDNEIIVCSNFDSTRVIIEIEGMPPFDLKYSVNDSVINWHINPGDLSDLDGDGEADNISILISGLSTITTDLVYKYELIEASSGGVLGKILDYSTVEVIAHVQPPAPVILPEWTEVTTGTTNIYTYQLSDLGVNPVEWFWYLRDMSTNMVNSFNSTTQSTFPIVFNTPPGLYYIEAQYSDNYGCLSIFDRLDIELFDLPTIAFSDSTPSVINCSATSHIPDEKFDFVVEYTGAMTFGFSYEVYDYNGTLVDGGSFDILTNRSKIITINNNFINDALPEENRPWKVVIKTAHNEDSRVNVKILDSDIEGGRDERIIMIYPKPFIHDDIDFAN